MCFGYDVTLTTLFSDYYRNMSKCIKVYYLYMLVPLCFSIKKVNAGTVSSSRSEGFLRKQINSSFAYRQGILVTKSPTVLGNTEVHMFFVCFGLV